MRTRTAVLALLVLVFTLFALAPVGCTTLHDARASRDQAVAAREHLRAAALSIESRLASLAPGDPARPALESRLARSRTTTDAISAGIDQIDIALLAADQPTGADPIIDAISAVIPGPWQAPLLLGGAAVGLFLRSRQLRHAVTTIAQGIEIAKREDPAFKEIFDRHANTFRSLQSPMARRLVDTITTPARKAPKSALPAPGRAPLQSSE